MRSRATAVVLALLLAACTPADPPARTTTRPATSAPEDTEAVLDSVRAFLEAYGRGPSGRDALARTTAGPHLEEWVRRLHLQTPGDETAARSTLDLRDLRMIGIRGGTAQVTVDATVTHRIESAPFEVARIVQSPMALIRDPDAPSGWSVVDAVRDGRPMRRSITLYEKATTQDDGLELAVSSVYLFTSGTVANVRITNRTYRPLRIDRPHSLMQAAGRFIGSTAATGHLLDPIAAGETVEGAFRFHTVPLGWVPEKVMVHFLDDAAPVISIDLPFEEFLASRE